MRGYQHWCLMKSMLVWAGRRPQVGRRLKGLARRNQVICVTHLAQIAGFADHHYAVSKRERKGRVMTVIEELGRDERAREIGRMLSGEKITAEALKHAEQLLEAGRLR